MVDEHQVQVGACHHLLAAGLAHDNHGHAAALDGAVALAEIRQHPGDQHRSSGTHEPQPVLDVLDHAFGVCIHQDDVVRGLVHAREHVSRAAADETGTRGRHLRIGESGAGRRQVLTLDVDGRQRRAG